MLSQNPLFGRCQTLKACQPLGLLLGGAERQVLPFAEPQQPYHPYCPHIILVQVQGG